MDNFLDNNPWLISCGGCLGILFLSICISAISAWIAMLLWNWLIPLFWAGAPILTFWQSWGIMFLLTLIGNRLFRNRNKGD